MNGGHLAGPLNATVVFSKEAFHLLRLVFQAEVELAVDDLQDIQEIAAVLTLQGKDFADHKEAIPAVLGIAKVFEFVNS